MARDVEKVSDEIERLSLFMPIKVVNGFVTCDFMLGCYCCRFCLNRRYPDWQRLLEQHRIYRNPLDVRRAADLLNRVKAFTHARVTLKIGHDTDMSLEEREAQELFYLLPPGYPVIWMRRGKLMPEFRPFYMKKRKNLLVKVTLTPRSVYLNATDNPFDVLESFRNVCCPMYYAIGPVCHDNYEEAKTLIDCLPSQSSMWVKELIIKDVPMLGENPPPLRYSAESLRHYAAERGHHVFDYLNCLVRAEVGLPFHKRGEFVSEKSLWELSQCGICRAFDRCDVQLSEPEERSRIAAALDDLGITLPDPPEKSGYKSYRCIARDEVNFGDECYLREKTSLKVDLSSPGRKTGTALTVSIIKRWQKKEIFPVDEMMALARESYRMAFEMR